MVILLKCQVTCSCSPFPCLQRPQFESRSKTKALFLYFDFLHEISNMQETPTQAQRSGLGPLFTLGGWVWGSGRGVGVKALMPAALSSQECHEDTWGLASFSGNEGPGCEGHGAFPAVLPKPLDLRNAGVEGWLGRHISYKSYFFPHRCPKASGQWLHPFPSSPAPIKQPLKEERDRGYFGLLSLLVRGWPSPGKTGLPPSLPWDLASSGVRMKRAESVGYLKGRFSRSYVENLNDKTKILTLNEN